MAIKSNSSRRRDRFVAGLTAAAFAAGVLSTVTLTPVLAKTEPANAHVLPVERASFADMIEAVSPAVVAISTSGKSAAGFDAPDFRLPPGSPFEDFYKRFFDERKYGGRGQAPARKYQAQGSGFIIDAAGVVVTNHHVVKGAEKISVITKDGKEYEAELKGARREDGPWLCCRWTRMTNCPT